LDRYFIHLPLRASLKAIALIMAGNIPLSWISWFSFGIELQEHKAVVNYLQNDTFLLPYLSANMLIEFETKFLNDAFLFNEVHLTQVFLIW